MRTNLPPSFVSALHRIGYNIHKTLHIGQKCSVFKTLWAYVHIPHSRVTSIIVAKNVIFNLVKTAIIKVLKGRFLLGLLRSGIIRRKVRGNWL